MQLFQVKLVMKVTSLFVLVKVRQNYEYSYAERRIYFVEVVARERAVLQYEPAFRETCRQTVSISLDESRL